MMALSVRQPWASLIVAGIKRVENRTWTTDYRGPLLVHASLDGEDADEVDDPRLPLLTELSRLYDAKSGAIKKGARFYRVDADGALVRLRDFTEDEEREEDFLLGHEDGLPFGGIIGAVMLEDVVRDSDDRFAERGFFHWIFDKPVELSCPEFQVNGKLRLWDFPTGKLNEAARRELSGWR